MTEKKFSVELDKIIFLVVMSAMAVGFTIVWTWLMLFVKPSRFETEMKVFHDRMDRAEIRDILHNKDNITWH